jgi:hypothetical protein
MHICSAFRVYPLLAFAILAEYSFFHSPKELAKMVTDLGTSSQWVAIKTAVSQLELNRKTLKSEMGRESLCNSITQIALANRLVSPTA